MTKPWSKSTRRGVRFAKWTLNEAGTTPQQPVLQPTYYSWTDTASGTTNPIWKESCASGEDATTGLSGQECTVISTPGHIETDGFVNNNPNLPANRRHAYSKGDFEVDIYRGYGTNGNSVAPALKRADSQFYAEAHNTIAALEGGELLGELAKTVKEIKLLASQGAHLLLDWKRTMKRFRRIPAKYKAGMVSDAYLRWKFGWDPLVKDVQALAGGLKEDFFEIIPISAFGKSTTCDVKDLIPFNPTNIITSYKSFVVTEESTVKYKAGIRVKRYGLGGFVERIGLSPRNFAPTLYNLLPWTYMIDYFTNLGTMVEAISFDRARVSWCNRTIRKSSIVTVVSGIGYKQSTSFENFIYKPGFPIVVPSTVKWTTKTVTRSADRPELPSLNFKLPNFQKTGGQIQGVNIAAVLSSMQWGSAKISRF